MRILHLATDDTIGGAARAAYRQHTALRKYGVDSEMLVRYKHSNDISVVQYAGNSGAAQRAARVLRRAWISYKEKQSRKDCRKIICGLNDPRADLLRSVDRRIAEADVINIHKVEHFVDLPALLGRLPCAKPVVITLHDISAITGGCDYPGSCRRFEAVCGCCPIIDSHRPNDYSHRIFHMKKMAYSRSSQGRLAFVANSVWSGEQARHSALTKDRTVEVIHYGLDQDVYSPRKRREAREALGIGAEESVVLFAAHDLELAHKGGRCLRDALVNVYCQRPIRLLTMGSGHFQSVSGHRHTHFGQVESDELQALLYRAADVFVIPSLEEAFGQTALEAIACGTVVAGFATGGIVDIVQNDLNGVLVARGDSNALGQVIMRLLNDKALRVRWQQACEPWVKARFSFDRNATAYHQLYESLSAG